MTASSAACCSPSILLPDSSYYYLLLFMPPPIHFTCGIFTTWSSRRRRIMPPPPPPTACVGACPPYLAGMHASVRVSATSKLYNCRVLFFLYSIFLLCASHNMANINSVDISRLKNGEINLGVGPLSSTYVQFPSDMCP